MYAKLADFFQQLKYHDEVINKYVDININNPMTSYVKMGERAAFLLHSKAEAFITLC